MNHGGAYYHDLNYPPSLNTRIQIQNRASTKGGNILIHECFHLSQNATSDRGRGIRAQRSTAERGGKGGTQNLTE
jgi:hypothetical protein